MRHARCVFLSNSAREIKAVPGRCNISSCFQGTILIACFGHQQVHYYQLVTKGLL